jgi:hypothetical protein
MSDYTPKAAKLATLVVVEQSTDFCLGFSNVGRHYSGVLD